MIEFFVVHYGRGRRHFSTRAALADGVTGGRILGGPYRGAAEHISVLTESHAPARHDQAPDVLGTLAASVAACQARGLTLATPTDRRAVKAQILRDLAALLD